MLTIKKISSIGAADYYASYALEKGESPGRFVDRDSVLGLNGAEASYEQVVKLMHGLPPDGIGPEGEKALCRNPGEQHVPGWDLTYSAPKSVSIAWSNSSPDLRREIERAHERAVKESLRFLGNEAAFTRAGAGGRVVESASLVHAIFQHSSNRAQEPQLHTHALLFNVARTHRDGKWRTLHARPIYRAYMAAGAIYKVELAHQMQRLGFETVRTKDSFELSVVPRAVCEAQSSRSRQIEEMLKQNGLSRAQASARTKEFMMFKTRAGKGRVVRDFDRWQRENAEHGFGPKELTQILRNARDLSNHLGAREEEQRAVAALDHLTAHDSTFNKYQLYRVLAEEAITKHGADGVHGSVMKTFALKDFVELGPDHTNEDRFSTQEMYRIEHAALKAVADRRGEDAHQVSDQSVARAIASRPSIKDEQVAALRHIVSGKDGVTFIEGDAGTGKSYLMGAVREIYERNGYPMIGVSFTNKAASGLAAGSGIKDCRSVDSFIHASRKDPEFVPRRSVIVLDEAGMLGSRKTLELLRIAASRGAKVVAIGDAKQIQPIGAGQIFGTLKNTFGAKRLSDIVRQTIEWERNAVHDLAEGRTIQALQAFDKKEPGRLGQLHILEDRRDARAAVILEWEKTALGSPGEAALMVTSTNAEVTKLNEMARERLVGAGQLDAGHEIQTAHGKHHFSAGDRIVFTDSLKPKGIFNSTLAQIEKINPRTKVLTVRTETGQRIRFHPKEMSGFRHGYAITAHKSQGSTVDRVLVLVDGYFMDREKTYVAMSRGRAGNTLFVDKTTIDELSREQRQAIKAAGVDQREAVERQELLKNLARLLGISHRKDTTQDYPGAHEAARRGAELTRMRGQMLDRLAGREASRDDPFDLAAEMLRSRRYDHARATTDVEQGIEPEHSVEPERDHEIER